ncbi:hypothetical protein ICJ33_00885 [Pseudomonas simiae]|uniref:hypothetical protein n=1 Tax=Pseudomonas simiae TaxID=321846 RepID=UPI0018E3BBCB|nr:hypothetical protein [Pseudomonas simiae]QQD27993.1 hypothetical protein ICJ33_00885 [Pseudomonas simiae]
MIQSNEDHSLLKTCLLSEEEGFVCLSGTDSELELAYQYLCSQGYKGSKELESAPVSRLWVSRQASAWAQSICPLFGRLEDLWCAYRDGREYPSFVYYFGDENDEGLITKLKIFFCWKRLLGLLADHEGAKGRFHSFIFFIATDKSSKKFELNPIISLEELLSVECQDGVESAIYNLESLLMIEDDIHGEERHHIMRLALAELVELHDVKCSFSKVMSSTMDFKAKYKELYDLYVRRFSVKKLLNEIDEKTSDYLVKVQDSISSSQTKAYAIPGALIAIAALVKSVSFLDFLLVIAGLLFVWYLTKVANDISREAYAVMSVQIDKSFSRYSELPDSSADVKAAAVEKKDTLDKMLVKAVKRLDAIDNLAVAMLAFGLLYLGVRFYSEVFSGWILNLVFSFWYGFFAGVFYV